MANTLLDQDIQVPREVPAGGTSGMLLLKNSATDYDVSWKAPQTLNNGTLTVNAYGSQVGTFTANQATDTTINIPMELKNGGTTGQYLTHENTWRTPLTRPTVYNYTITINQNGNYLGSFSLNQSGNTTINVTIP